MSNESKEIIDSTNDEATEEVTEDTNEDNQEDTQDNSSEKPHETPEAKRARLKRQLEQHDKKYPELNQVSEKKNAKSNDLDYGEKAYLTANGIKGAKEFDFVKAELKASGQNLDSLLENDYFKDKLEKFRALSKTADATPTGKRSGGVATDSVDYWAAKPFEEVPKDMRQKVVQYKIDKEKNKGQFYNS